MGEALTATIAGQTVGTGAPTWIVIELGVTHEGDSDLARRMISASKRAGADAVKVECIDPDALVAPSHRASLEYSHRTASGRQVTENYYELLRRVSLSRDEIRLLRDAAGEAGIPFFGTAFDLRTVDVLAEIGSCAIKISSGEITHLPLIRHAAASGLPVIIDTGRSSVAEICRAAQVAQEGGCATPVIMHNPSGYPAAPGDVNLPTIPKLKSVLDLPVGFSCHSQGNDMVLGALAVGADVLEKPISRDNTIEEDEHIFSVNLDGVEEYVQRIRALEKALTFDRARFFPPVNPARQTFRQSVVATKDIRPGEVIGPEHLGFARPGWGIAPELSDSIVGRRAVTSIEAGAVIEWGDVN